MTSWEILYRIQPEARDGLVYRVCTYCGLLANTCTYFILYCTLCVCTLTMVLWLMLAPASSNTRTTSLWPLSDAIVRGVSWLSYRTEGKVATSDTCTIHSLALLGSWGEDTMHTCCTVHLEYVHVQVPMLGTCTCTSHNIAFTSYHSNWVVISEFLAQPTYTNIACTI